MSDTEYCFRACFGTSKTAKRYCPHEYDVMGCNFSVPGSYKPGVFEECKGEVSALAPGEYKLPNGSTSTWHQGLNPTPAAQRPAKTSQCKKSAPFSTLALVDAS